MLRWLFRVLNHSEEDYTNGPDGSDQLQYDNETRQRSSLMAIWVGTFCALGGFLYGYDTGIINSLLSMNYVKKRFASHDGYFTPMETAITTAILSLGTFVGALLASMLSDSIGRRKTIIVITSVVFPVGTVIQILATGIPLLCVGRFISGIAVGIISAVVPVYQSELSPKWIRGSVVSTYQWAITWGLLVSSLVSQGTHSIDDSRSYRIPILLQMIWTYILAGGMYLLPESPRYYVKRDKLDCALQSLSRLRKLPPANESLIEELVEIKAQHDYEASFGDPKLLDCFRSSPSRHSQLSRMLTGMGLQCIQQSTGINFIFYYGVNFFVKSGLSHSYIMSLATYTVNVAATIPGIICIEIFGRRKLLLIGATGMTVSNLIIGIVGVTTDSKVANQVMIAFVCVFIAFFASTWGPGVWVICSEIYSLDIRSKAVSITASMNWIVNFAFAFITPYLVDTGNHTASLGTKIFFIWGGCSFLGLIFSYFCVYETKGLMLEEVDEMYRCCKNASKSVVYKSKIHEKYLNNELGFLNNGSESPDVELNPIDLKSQNGDSSSSPTNTTLGQSSSSNNRNNNVANNNTVSQAGNDSNGDRTSNDVLESLHLSNQGGFVPDLDFSKFQAASQDPHSENIYHVSAADRSPPSLDSLSFYESSSSSSSESVDNNAGPARYSYMNEADLANFINGLNHARNSGSSTSASNTVKLDLVSSSTSLPTSGASLQKEKNEVTTGRLNTEEQEQTQTQGQGNTINDYSDILSSLRLASISGPQSTTNWTEEGQQVGSISDTDSMDDDSFLDEMYNNF